MNKKQSVRSKIITRRTYNRPLDDKGTIFEEWKDTVKRVILHQRWLWLRATGNKEFTYEQEEEFNILYYFNVRT